MVCTALNYSILTDHIQLFACCLVVVLMLSLGLLFFCQWRRWTSIIAVVFTLVWVVLLLPDTQYYLGTRGAGPDSIIEPFYWQHQIYGYILVLLPIPFVLLGLYRRRKRTI